jgi:Ca2+-transporting ATPase
VHLSPPQRLLGTKPLSLADLLIVCAAAIVGYVAIRLDRVVHPTKHPPRPATPAGGSS